MRIRCWRVAVASVALRNSGSAETSRLLARPAETFGTQNQLTPPSSSSCTAMTHASPASPPPPSSPPLPGGRFGPSLPLWRFSEHLVPAVCFFFFASHCALLTAPDSTPHTALTSFRFAPPRFNVLHFVSSGFLLCIGRVRVDLPQHVPGQYKQHRTESDGGRSLGHAAVRRRAAQCERHVLRRVERQRCPGSEWVRGHGGKKIKARYFEWKRSLNCFALQWPPPHAGGRSGPLWARLGGVMGSTFIDFGSFSLSLS